MGFNKYPLTRPNKHFRRDLALCALASIVFVALVIPPLVAVVLR